MLLDKLTIHAQNGIDKLGGEKTIYKTLHIHVVVALVMQVSPDTFDLPKILYIQNPVIYTF